jgi:hypothetical protein
VTSLCLHGPSSRTRCLACRIQKQLKAADELAKAAKWFREMLNCYSQGCSFLVEEDVKPLDKALIQALAAYEKVRGR